MPDDLPSSWKRQGLKIVGVLAASAFAGLAARYRLDVATWTVTVSRLPRWALGLIVAGVPVAWILIVFLAAFFKELGVLASSGGRSAAQAVAHAPEALKNVLGRGWDRAAACLSGWSFDGRYRRRLYEDYGPFNDRGLGLINANRLDLEKVYVELQVSAQAVPSRMELLRHPMEGRHTVWDFLRAVKPGRGLALIGPPGSGKTTLLQHLLLVFARNRQGRHGLRRLLPILVELRNLTEALKKETPPTLADAIRSYWKTERRIADLMKLEPTGWLEKRLRSSRVLLLLDGLDEVPQAQRMQVSAWVQEQMRHDDHRRCLFLLTSRPGGYVDAPLSEATVLEVQSFSPAQTSKFIDGWYLANEIAASGNEDSEPVRRRATRGATDLRDRLRENPGLYDLTVNPLLLTMVCMVHRYRGALPGSRSQLYEEICKVLLERWRQAKGIAEDLTGEQKLAVLRTLAEEFMRREAREMLEEDILPVIAAPLASIGYRDEGGVTAGQRFLRFIQVSSGLLLEKEKGRWSFAHKTFQEYLTAEHWLRTPNLVPDWAAKVPSDWWRETLLLFAACTDASGLVEAALAEDSPASWELAYQCLNEAQSLRPEVRGRAESTLRQALHSDDLAVFTPAATAFHDLRQREVRPISEKVEQRATLVTQAEYQLFLNQLFLNRLYGAESLEMAPPHWTAARFVGDPEAPILGVWPWQASSFAQWADRGAAQASWRLPAGPEPAELPPSTAAYWRDDNTLSPLPTGVTDMMDGWAKQHHLGQLQTSTRALALDLASDLGLVFDLARDRVFDLALNLANLALARTLAIALDRARDLDLDPARDRDRRTARDRAPDLARDLDHALAIALHLTGDLASDLAARDLASEIREIRAIASNFFSGIQNEGDPASGRRRRLLVSMRDVLTAGTDPVAARRAWRTYAICLLDIAHPHLNRKGLDKLEPIEFTLRLLIAREAGEVQPYEGILLVRDRNAP
jgi:energy-coupling factor transporter ATP-binding protein EcfA2